MNTEIKNAVMATDARAQYDECAKRLLSNKHILAHILIKTVDVFRNMHPKDVIPLIEGNIQISPSSIEPGTTNKTGSKLGDRIVGANTESIEQYEGLAWLDIVFYVHLPNSDTKEDVSQIIINLEAQKDEPKEYDVLNRAVFYVSRMISSQKERDFVGTRYNDIRRVYSIWICMNIAENCMEYVHLKREKILGSYEWKGNIDLINIVFIGLSDVIPEHNKDYELHRLLGTLFSMTMSVKNKLNILEEYDIPLEREIEGGMVDMCNLGQGVLERGLAMGIEQGIEQGIEKGRKERDIELIISMHKNGISNSKIAFIVDKSEKEIEGILAGLK